MELLGEGWVVHHPPNLRNLQSTVCMDRERSFCDRNRNPCTLPCSLSRDLPVKVGSVTPRSRRASCLIWCDNGQEWPDLGQDHEMSLHYPDHWSPASEPPMSHVHMELRSRRRNYLNLPPPVGVTPVSHRGPPGTRPTEKRTHEPLLYFGAHICHRHVLESETKSVLT